MTYIEFFDEVASKNISTCLTYVPDRVIYLGDDVKLIDKHIANYKKVFEDRGLNIEFVGISVSKSKLDEAEECLTEIVKKYDDCVFDITGGDEILNLALGIVYAKNPEKNIRFHKFNLRNNVMYDCDKDGKTIFQDAPKLTVEENIKIYGGDIVYETGKTERTCVWDLNEDFLKDIDLLWTICKCDARAWNAQIGVFRAMEEVGKVSEDGLTTVASRGALDYHLTLNKAKYKISNGIISYLRDHDLLAYFDDSNPNAIKITYKNMQIKKCLTKEGQALEMKVFVTAKNVLDKEGNPVYNDARYGVVIDWDGEFHDKETDNVVDTENEVDVLLMHGVVPVFVSCKNGTVTPEELYKLETVAERFGGEYSKKVLIATTVDGRGDSGAYFRQRAKDMNIKLIEKVHELDDLTLARRIKNLWNT